MPEPTDQREMERACTLAERVVNGTGTGWTRTEMELGSALLRMKAAVDKAPRGFDCASSVLQSQCAGYGKCDCWKAELL